MFENRSLKLDITALVLLALGAFLAVSLVSYDRTDAPSTIIYPANPTVNNACGTSGAYAAHYLFESFGWGAFYAVGSLLVVAVFLVMRREIDQPILRAVGWAVSLIGLVTLIAIAMPNLSPGPIVGAGGYIGAMGRGLLEMHFATTGAAILTVTIFLAGVFLATDYFFLKLAAGTTLLSGKGLTQLGHLGASSSLSSLRGLRKETDLDDNSIAQALDENEEGAEEDDEEWEYEDEEEETADEETEITVRTRPKGGEEGEADEADEEETDEKDNEKGSEETAEASSVTKALKTALTIKKPKKAQPKPKSEREEIIDQLEAADHTACDDIDYELPSLDLLLESEQASHKDHEQEVRRKAKILEKTFNNFGFNVKVVEIETGPVIAQYEIQLEAGLRLSKITGLSDDLAIALRVPSVRIVAPIPGKNTVGIEVPNEHRQLVRLRDVIEETNGHANRMKIPIYLGKDVSGRPLTVDLTTLPHLLIAGRTGTGKSVCLNSIIVSILMSRGPDEVRMLMIDPKMVELSGYRKLPHLMHPVVTDMKKAEAILAWGVDKMEERYQLLARAGVRHVTVFNQLSDEELRDRIKPRSDAEWEEIPRTLPFIVIVADEIADLMMTAGKDVEQHIIRLAQKSRAVGIHLILATQKPTVDVITGLIKSNLPARIAFQVASRTDSRVVLDENGADKLLGNGDMLFLSPGTSTLLRGQGTFLSDDEITRVVDAVGTDDPQFAGELMELKTKEEQESTDAKEFKNRDEHYEAAVDIVVRERRGSCSLLQRSLGIGYGRAARLIDFMAEDGIVGQYNGSQAREVLISLDDWAAMTGDAEAVDSEATATEEAPAKPSNRIIPEEDEAEDELEDEDEVAEEEVEEEEVDELEEDEEADELEEDTAEEDELEEEDEDEVEEEAAEDEDGEEYEYVDEDEEEDPDYEYEYEDAEAEDEEELEDEESEEEKLVDNV